jgi:YegS/Rv2252/BmrU family lipid kinase
MTQVQSIFFIINLHAGSGKAQKVIDSTIPQLLDLGHSVDFALTKHAGHATELAKNAQVANYDMVVAVGGDGTVNEVAKGLIETVTKLGIVPTGSGNGLARTLGINKNATEIVEILGSGSFTAIDACEIGPQMFLCTSGIGFDAHISHLMASEKKRGFLTYVRLVIKESLKYKAINLKLKLDSKVIETNAFLVTFANAPQFGNDAFIAPKARMTDGLIDVVVVRPFAKILLPLFSIALFAKFIHWLPFVDYYQASEVKILTASSQQIHFDGEPGILQFPAKVQMLESKINVVSVAQNL